MTMKKLEQLRMDRDILMFEIKMTNGFELRFQKEISLLYQLEYIIDSSQQKQILSRFSFCGKTSFILDGTKIALSREGKRKKIL